MYLRWESNTAHPRQSLFLRNMSYLRWDSNPRHTTLDTERSTTELPRQLSWLGPNLTSHSTPDEQAYYQLSMKEKAGAMKPPKTPNTKPSICFNDERRNEERSKQDQTSKKAKQHSTPKAVTFPKKIELPQVGCTA